MCFFLKLLNSKNLKGQVSSRVSTSKLLTMMFLVMLCFLHLPGNKGASHSNRVFQTPPFIIKKAGESVTSEINCSHSITNYDRILWYKQDEQGALQFLGYLNLANPYPEDSVKGKISFDGDGRKNSRLSISDLALNDSGVYFCAARDSYNEAYFGAGTKLTVLDPDLNVTPPTVKVLHPSKKECKNKRGNAEKTIVCVATRFYPDHVSVSWQVNGEDVSTGVATDNTAQREDKDKYYTITSRLRVSAKEWYNPSTEFKCTVRFFNGTDTEPFSDSIFGDKAKEGVLTREKYLKITQTAKLSYGVFIVKSMVYGVFVAFLVWKLQNSSGKRNH